MRQGSFKNSRWDRHIPETGQDIDNQELNENIQVLAWFKNARIYPRVFAWKGKIYRIKKITYNWQEKCGRETINYFSVDTGASLYQISFNNTSYAWKIDKII